MASESVDVPKPAETPPPPQTETSDPTPIQSDSTSDVEVKPEIKDQPQTEENTESTETKNKLSKEDISKLPRELGCVKWFNVKAGYGFIMRASGEDIFIHQTAIINNNPTKSERSVREGENVEYTVIRGVKGPEVAEVTGPGLAPVLGSDYARNKGDFKGRVISRQSRVRSYQNRGRNPPPTYRGPPRSTQRQPPLREPYHYQQYGAYPPRNGYRDYPEPPIYRDRPYVEHYRDQYVERDREGGFREREGHTRDQGYDPAGPRPARNFYSRRISRPVEGDRDRERDRDVERDRDFRRRRVPRFESDREYRDRPMDGVTRGEGMERDRTRGPRENRSQRGMRKPNYRKRSKKERDEREEKEEKEADGTSPVSSDQNVNSLAEDMAELQVNGEPDSSEQVNGVSEPIVDAKRVDSLEAETPESASVEA